MEQGEAAGQREGWAQVKMNSYEQDLIVLLIASAGAALSCTLWIESLVRVIIHLWKDRP